MSDNTRQRQDYIVGKPPRIEALKPEEVSDEALDIASALSGRLSIPPGAKTTRDKISDFMGTMLHHPKLCHSHFDVGISLLREGDLTPRDRELGVLRTGWLCQAPFEWGAHVAIGSSAPGWSDHDRAILKAVEELHDDAMISDETWAKLEADFSKKLLIELLVMIGQYHSLAYVQNSLRLRLNPGNEGLLA